MALGQARLRSERTRSPGELLCDDPEASHVYAWLFYHDGPSIEAYLDRVDVNERQARLATNRLLAHGLLTETEAGYDVEAIHMVVDGVHVTPGVAAVLAVQLENSAVREFVRRHGPLTLARAASLWPMIDEGSLPSVNVGSVLGVGRNDGVTATNALRAVESHLEADPELDSVPLPEELAAVV